MVGVLRIFIGTAFCNWAIASSIKIGLEANWTQSDFAIQLIEAASLYNESLYYQSTRALFQASDNESDWDEETFETEITDSFGQWPLSDRGCYENVVKDLTPLQKDFVNINLVHQMASPRIEAHFKHFKTEIEAEFLPMVQKHCARDSFGQPIPDPTSVWIKYGLKIYCSEEDLYALQLTTFSEKKAPFDRVIGDTEEAPLLALYGSPSSPRFSSIFNTLYQFAKNGNLRFVWRYVPDSEEMVPLYGYGTTLTALEKKQNLTTSQGDIGSLEEFIEKYEKSALHEISEEEMIHAAYMATSAILNAPLSKQLPLLTNFVNRLPLFAPYLAKSKMSFLIDKVKQSALHNERIGASSDMVGISINGATVHRLETDLPYILKKLQDEVEFIDDMLELGFTTAQAKFLFSKNALHSAIKESQYHTGTRFNRFLVHEDIFKPNVRQSGGVVFFNDIEQDSNYDLFSTDPYEVYVESSHQIRMGQVPPLKQNVHHLIFVINLSDRDQLRVFFAMSKIILDKGIPQQLGILPLVGNPKDQKITAFFYHLIEVGEVQEALALLYKYYETTDENENTVLELVKLSEDLYDDYKNNAITIEKFDITEPSVVVNGIIQSLRTDWQSKLVDQISRDVNFLKSSLLDSPSQLNLRDLLHLNSNSKRNRKVIPQSPANIRYKKIHLSLIENSLQLYRIVKNESFGPTFWLLGDFNSITILAQLKEVLRFMKASKRSVQIRLFNTALHSAVFDSIEKEFVGSRLTVSKIVALIDLADSFQIQTALIPNAKKLEILRDSQIQLHHPALLLNSRYSKIDKALTKDELLLMVEFEFEQRLNFLNDIVADYPEQFEGELADLAPSDIDSLTWFDLVTSVITASIFLEDSTVRTDFGRFDFSSLNYENLIDLTGYDSSKHLDVLIVVDPLDKTSQKLLSIVSTLKSLSFVNLLILIQPFSYVSNGLNSDRFYISNFISSKPNFDPEGNMKTSPILSMTLGDGLNLRSDLDAPSNWHFVKGSKSEEFDLENLSTMTATVANYTLSQIVTEANVKDVLTGQSVPGLVLSAFSQETSHEGYTVKANGYCQLRLEPGSWTLNIMDNLVQNETVELLSASSNRYETNDQALDLVDLPMYSLFGKTVYLRIRRKEHSETDLKRKAMSAPHGANSDINVFCVTSDFSSDHFMAVLIESITRNTSKNVKFWLLENFLSEKIRKALPQLSKTYKFRYEFVSYKWPLWLRQQNSKTRQLAAYKILFLDVLFPMDLQKVIVIDVDLIVQTDLYDLVEEDMHDAVYGLSPMCETRPEKEIFWKQGYWKNVLGDDLKYFSSSLIVVDLIKFRATGAGEYLRRQYQKFSSDPNSLVILDQDLINNLQRLLPIHPLSSNWNWSPTWCDESEKPNAKIIQFETKGLKKIEAFNRARHFVSSWAPILSDDTNGSESSEIVHDEF